MYASKKNPSRKYKAPTKSFNVGASFERIAVDILGPLLVQSKEINTFFLMFYLPSRIFASTSVESAVISSLIKDSNVRDTC